MKKTLAFTGITVALCAVFLLDSCIKKNDEVPQGQNGYIQFQLTDLPADYLEVNVDIKQVRIHLVATTGNDGWLDLPTHAGIYNLLDLQNGIDSTIVDSTQISAGKITQVRLVLGGNNTVMTSDSVLHDLKVPSGTESGIKLVGNLTIPASNTLHVLLDFDANASVNQLGNGQYKMKPVIKVIQ